MRSTVCQEGETEQEERNLEGARREKLEEIRHENGGEKVGGRE